MDHIKVDFGAVGELGSSIDQRVSNITQVLDDLRTQIAQLEQIWTGGAGDGFQQTKNKWNQSADDLNQVLARISTAVHTANDNYQTTESSNQKRWG